MTNDNEKAKNPLWLRALAKFLSKISSLPSEEIEELLARLYHVLQAVWVNPDDPYRRLAVRLLVLILAALIFLIYWFNLRVPIADRKDLAGLVEGGCWLTYDPPSYDPISFSDPSLAKIRGDLNKIRDAGFTGIVTFSSRGKLAEIPRIARGKGLSVIMGIWNPGDAREKENAIRQNSFANAYCVGHNGLDRPGGYSFEELEQAIRLIQRSTGRPVTTSEEARFYEDPRLAHLGDWLFPDVHLSLLDSLPSTARADLKRDLELQFKVSHEMARLAHTTGKPLMLKMLSYPWAGADGASIEVQRGFFVSTLEALRSPERGLPVSVGVVVHGAFDVSWKKGYPFYSWDPYTGVIERYGAPRPAALEILERCRHERAP